MFSLLFRGGSRSGRRLLQRIALPITLLAAVVIVPWMIRGVLTSGYIAYPLSIGRVEVEWAEPIDMLEHRQERLATNTRQRYADADQVLTSWQWVGPWFKNIRNDVATFVLPVAIMVAALGLTIAGRIVQPGAANGERPSLWIYLPLLLMLDFLVFQLSQLQVCALYHLERGWTGCAPSGAVLARLALANALSRHLSGYWHVSVVGDSSRHRARNLSFASGAE